VSFPPQENTGDKGNQFTGKGEKGRPGTQWIQAVYKGMTGGNFK